MKKKITIGAPIQTFVKPTINQSTPIHHQPIHADPPSELYSTPIQTHHQPIPVHHHAQIKPRTQPSSGASLERERVRTERKRDFAEKNTTINRPPLHTERNREWEMERQSGSEGERTDGIKN